MSTTKPTAAQQLAEHLEAGRQETDRLQAQADAIDAAEHEAKKAARLAHFLEANSTKSWQYRDTRDAVRARLDEIAAAPELDVDALRRTFIELKMEDAKCGALSIHAATLNNLDPLPDNFAGVPQTRPTQVGEIYAQWTWAAYLEQTIKAHADRIRAQHLQSLQVEAHEDETRAGDEARTAAAAEQ